MTDNSYHGWANEETFSVFIWLTGTPASRQWVAALFEEFPTEPRDILLFRTFRDLSRQLVDDPTGVDREKRQAIQLFGSLWRVDWEAIAKRLA